MGARRFQDVTLTEGHFERETEISSIKKEVVVGGNGRGLK